MENFENLTFNINKHQKIMQRPQGMIKNAQVYNMSKAKLMPTQASWIPLQQNKNWINTHSNQSNFSSKYASDPSLDLKYWMAKNAIISSTERFTARPSEFDEFVPNDPTKREFMPKNHNIVTRNNTLSNMPLQYTSSASSTKYVNPMSTGINAQNSSGSMLNLVVNNHSNMNPCISPRSKYKCFYF